MTVDGVINEEVEPYSEKDFKRIQAHVRSHLEKAYSLEPDEVEDYYNKLLSNTVDVRALVQMAAMRADGTMAMSRGTNFKDTLAGVWLEGFVMGVSIAKSAD